MLERFRGCPGGEPAPGDMNCCCGRSGGSAHSGEGSWTRTWVPGSPHQHHLHSGSLGCSRTPGPAPQVHAALTACAARRAGRSELGKELAEKDDRGGVAWRGRGLTDGRVTGRRAEPIRKREAREGRGLTVNGRVAGHGHDLSRSESLWGRGLGVVRGGAWFLGRGGDSRGWEFLTSPLWTLALSGDPKPPKSAFLSCVSCCLHAIPPEQPPPS